MKQLGQLQNLCGEFKKRNTTVVAVANEENDLYGLIQTTARFGDDGPAFVLLADLDRKKTRKYERTTAYFVDKKGIIRQVFPMEIYDRPSWWPILNEIDRLSALHETEAKTGSERGTD